MTCAGCSAHCAVSSACSGWAGVVNIFSSINIGFLFAVGPSWWSWDHHRTHVTQCHMTGHDTLSWHMTVVTSLCEVNTQQNSFIINGLRINIKQITCLHLGNCKTSKSLKLTLRTDTAWVFYWSINFDISNHLRIKFDYFGYCILKDNKDADNSRSKYNLVKVVNQMNCGRDHFLLLITCIRGTLCLNMFDTWHIIAPQLWSHDVTASYLHWAPLIMASCLDASCVPWPTLPRARTRDTSLWHNCHASQYPQLTSLPDSVSV